MKKVITEIPIYSMSEADFRKRWKPKENKAKYSFLWDKFTASPYYHPYEKNNHMDAFIRFVQKLDKTSRCEIEREVKSLWEGRDIWKYNQIIGYIQVVVTTSNAIEFNFYISRYERYRIDSPKKHCMYYENITGTHFPLLNMSNNEIRTELRKRLQQIRLKELLSLKKAYIDLSTFNNIINYIDIKKIAEDLRNAN